MWKREWRRPPPKSDGSVAPAANLVASERTGYSPPVSLRERPSRRADFGEALPGEAPPAAAEGVGHCRPPVATRFRLGRRGNPRDRPRQKRRLGTVVAAALSERVDE